MNMTVMQQIHYREKMYKRGLGMQNKETGELNTAQEAMDWATMKLREKMAPELSIADKAPGKEDGYQPRVASLAYEEEN